MANRSYNWECVVWVENLESVDKIFDFRVKGYLSPLHDKDGGKPHYHWIMCFDSLKTYDQVMQMLKDDGLDTCVNTVRYIRDLTSSARYLCHLDERKKFHYDTDLVQCIGGTSYSKFLEYETDKAMEDMSVIETIDKYRIRSYAQLVRYCLYIDKVHYKSVVGRTGFWNAYMKSLTYDAHNMQLEYEIQERQGLKNEDLQSETNGYIKE